MEIQNILNNRLKESPNFLEIDSQKLLYRGGYFRVEKNQIYFLDVGHTLIDLVIKEILNKFNIKNKISSLESFQTISRVILKLDQEIKSYKNTVWSWWYLSKQINPQYKLNYGLFNTKIELILNLIFLDSSMNNEKLKLIFTKILQSFNVDTLKIESNDLVSYFYVFDRGNDQYIECENCSKISHFVSFKKINKPLEERKNNYLKFQKIHTPNCKSINELSAFLNIDKNRIVKSMLFKGFFEGKTIYQMVLIRGDLDIDINKLIFYDKNHELNIENLALADDEDIKNIDSVPGFISPVNLDKSKYILLADFSILDMINFVTGANEIDYHYINVNTNRDFKINQSADFAQNDENSLCNNCGHKLSIKSGVEFGYNHGSNNKIKFIDKDGKLQYNDAIIFKIDILKLISIIANTNYDDFGVTFPINIAPFQVSFINLSKKEKISKEILKLYKSMAPHYRLLIDDRNVNPGVKFNDADLLGIPIQVIFSEKLYVDLKCQIKEKGIGKKPIFIKDLKKELKKLIDS